MGSTCRDFGRFEPMAVFGGDAGPRVLLEAESAVLLDNSGLGPGRGEVSPKNPALSSVIGKRFGRPKDYLASLPAERLGSWRRRRPPAITAGRSRSPSSAP